MNSRAMSERDMRNAWSVFRSEAHPIVEALRHCHTEPQAEQRKRLASILAASKDSLFALEHDFSSIDCYETYANRVPQMQWNEMQPWIDKSCTEDDIVLGTEQPLFFEPTSGSSAAVKLIPYTSALLQEFQRAVVAWIAMLYDDCPEISTGPHYWALSPPVPSHAPTANGITVGGAGDAVYLAGSCAAPLLSSVLNPSELSAQPDQWRAQTLAAMINAPDLRMISVWSPTFLSALIDPLETSVAAVDTLQQHLNQRQQAILKRALSHGSFEEFWPDLAVISCWMDGPSERYAKKLCAWFPQSRFSPKGLLATEGVVSISQGLSGMCPLALDSHFIEFSDANDRCLLADELIAGERYRPLLTTSGGLYRYALGDVIESVGKHDGMQCIRFVGRVDARCDLVGEKLDESLVATACDTLGVRGENAVLVPLAAHGVTGYALLIDSDDSATAIELAQQLETRLMGAHHYALARNIGQLAEIKAITTQNTTALLQTVWQSMGRRIGDLKPARLIVSLPFAHAIMTHVSKHGSC